MTRQTLAFVESALPVPAKRVLEIGCGEGDLAALLTVGERAVVGVDPSPVAAAKARALGVDVRQVDWMEFVEGDPFDAVLFTRSLHHLHDLEGAVARCNSFLRPGGRIVVEDFAFADEDAQSAEWIRSLLRILRAAGRLDEVEGSQASILLRDGSALDLWFEDHQDIHTAATMEAALLRHFQLLSRDTAPYLYRYVEPCLAPTAANERLLEEILSAEIRAMASGAIRPLGRRWVLERRDT